MRKIFFGVILLSFVLLIASGCVGAEVSPDGTEGSSSQKPGAIYQKISAAEASKMMREADSYILLDVRTVEEFAEAHIGGATLIPDFELEDKAATQLPDRDALILIYCRSGRRSAAAAKLLTGMGYINVYDFGGIINWPYETVSK